jgi:hypothetical protein
MEKVVYISYQPLTKKFYNDYYLDTCIENGLKIEYWDITKIYFKNLILKDTLDINEIKKFYSFRELKVELSKTDIMKTLFITNITFGYKVLRLFRILSVHKCKLAFFARGMYPSPVKTESTKIIETIRSFDYYRMLNGINNRIASWLKKIGTIKTYDIIFRAGSEGVITIGAGYFIDKLKAKIIDINYFDFDKYLTCKNENLPIKQNYCVYLDEYLPYHPDWQIINVKSVTPEDYYINVNNFFEKIENRMNVEVVIAAHPKALNYEKENPFNGRKIFFGKTCELIRDSSFSLTHHSTSISFPILFGKPIIFITSESQKKIMPDLYELSFYFSSVLNSSFIHFDSYKGEDIGLEVDNDKYDDYKYKYLTSKASEGLISSDIFIETVSKL